MRENWLIFLSVGSIVCGLVFIFLFLRIETFISLMAVSVLGAIFIYYDEFKRGNLPTPMVLLQERCVGLMETLKRKEGRS